MRERFNNKGVLVGEEQNGAKGVLITPANPQPEIRKNAEIAEDWEWREYAAKAYQFGKFFIDRLIDPVHRLDRDKMPEAIYGFENLRNYRTLAYFLLVRNSVGLNYEITFNTKIFAEQEVNGKKEKIWTNGGMWGF